MSTSAHAIASAVPLPGIASKHKDRRPESPSLRPRQSTADQARGLQAITHAIEYLLDSRLFDAWQSASDATAVHILMACSRLVFKDCEVLDAWPSRVPPAPVRQLQAEPKLPWRRVNA